LIDTDLFIDLLLLALLSGGAVFLAMRLVALRNQRRLDAAQHNETRFRDLTSLSADWFWETDADYRTTWISGGATVATFFGDMPTYGKRIWEIPGIEVDARSLEALRERLAAQQPFFDLETDPYEQTNLVDDQPPRLARVLSSHPPVRDRVMAALRQAERGAAAPSAAAGRHG